MFCYIFTIHFVILQVFEMGWLHEPETNVFRVSLENMKGWRQMSLSPTVTSDGAAT